MMDLRLTSTRLGLPARSWKVRPEDLVQVPLPAIAFINKRHFVVIRKFVTPEILEVDDPALGKVQWPIGRFFRVWSGEILVFDPAWNSG
jgi:ABC-type bacteriocin/lantibiotic exporter with double-glycine peptidase domain